MVWIAIGLLGLAVAFLLLAVLGAMREIVVLRGDVKAFRDLVQRPPAPSFVDDRLPRALSKHLSQRDVSGDGMRRLVMFLSPGCQPCQDLAEGLMSAIGAGRLESRQITAVIWAFTPQEAARYASHLALDCILDGDGKLSRACEVRATPTLFIVSTGNYKVLDYSPEGSMEWVISRLTAQDQVTTAA